MSVEAGEMQSWKFTKDISKEGKGNFVIEKSIRMGGRKWGFNKGGIITMSFHFHIHPSE